MFVDWELAKIVTHEQLPEANMQYHKATIFIVVYSSNIYSAVTCIHYHNKLHQTTDV